MDNMLAVRQHGVPVERLGLEPGSPLLASLKQKVRLIICWLCAAAQRPCGAAGSVAGESATRLTQAEGEMDNMLAVCGRMASPWSGWVWSRGVRYSPLSRRR
jgi:hypothetical protein